MRRSSRGAIFDELVSEGDFVTAGQVLAHMDTESLEAQRREAVAKLGMAKSSVDTAHSTLLQRESEKAAAQAVVAQREAELELATSNFARGESLAKTGRDGEGGRRYKAFGACIAPKRR